MSSASPEQLRLAAALPRYEIREVIGRGGWGVVYEAWHTVLQRPVAVKQLPETFGGDPAVRDRFVAEAQLVAGLQHPHIVPVFDFVEHDGLYVIVMELCDGGTLWQRFSEHGLVHEHAIASVLAASVGLHHAHQRGLVHRDVKPDNVLFGGDGIVKIADFGIAKVMSETQAARTATGSVIGTPAYMAPEQVTGDALGPATDVYALAVMTYELLSGQLPYRPVTEAIAQLFQHVHEEPRPLTDVRADAPPELAAVIERAMAKSPAERPESAEQFAVELAEAATSAFGTGWLGRTGIEVMGSTRVVGATERAASAQWTTSEVTRPDETERLRLSEPAMPATATAPAAPVVPTARPTRIAATAPPPGAGAADATTVRRPRGSSRLLLGGAAALVAILALVGALAAFGGGDDDPAPTPIANAVSAREVATFRETCVANGVNDARCGCAVDRAVVQLSPDEFRAGLAELLERDGALSEAFATVFDSCVADGF